MSLSTLYSCIKSCYCVHHTSCRSDRIASIALFFILFWNSRSLGMGMSAESSGKLWSNWMYKKQCIPQEPMSLVNLFFKMSCRCIFQQFLPWEDLGWIQLLILFTECSPMHVLYSCIVKWSETRVVDYDMTCNQMNQIRDIWFSLQKSVSFHVITHSRSCSLVFLSFSLQIILCISRCSLKDIDPKQASFE